MIAQLIKYRKLVLLFTFFSFLLYGAFAYQLERSDFIKLITLYAALFLCFIQLIKRGKNHFWLLAGIAILARLVFLPAIPNLSQDFYRFIWDGRIAAEGLNPYLTTVLQYIETGQTGIIPQAQELYQGMGDLNASHYTNYPPVNQLCFVIAGWLSNSSIPGAVVVFRILIILADIGIIIFGKKLLERLKLPSYHIFWYALNPFVIIEMTGNLHFESVMLFFLIWSLYLLYKGKWIGAAIVFALSVSVKLIPLLFLPLLFSVLFSGKKWLLEAFKWLAKTYRFLHNNWTYGIIDVCSFFIIGISSEFHSNHWLMVSEF